MTREMINEIVRKNLQKYRMENHLTQEALAEKAGISLSFYSNLERGHKSMSLHVLRKLADSLNVSTDFLLYEDCTEGRIKNISLLLKDKPESFIITVEQVLRALIDTRFDQQ